MTTISNLKLKSKLYYYAAHVTAVYDGDTVTVDMDLGLGMWRHGQTVRLWRINAPELKGVERPQGLVVRDFVRNLVLDKPILLRTILDKRGEDQTGKFGRLLGEILYEDESGQQVNLNELLLSQGMVEELGADGSKLHALPPADTRALPSAAPATINCPFCGQARAVDPTTLIVAVCPNCLDAPRALNSFEPV
ncbi:MAG: thermonuclease family protein [Caldilineaceae bacterium]